jgi:replicative DNA helicase
MTDTLYNINIERAILSSILYNPETFENIASEIKKDDFYLRDHANIFQVMDELSNEDKPIDEEFIKKKLQQKNEYKEDILLDILSTSPLSSTGAYLQELRDKAIKRELITLISTINEEAVEKDAPANDVVDKIQQKLYSITSRVGARDFRDSFEIVKATLEHIELMKARGNQGVVGLDTGYHELNKLTNGFGEGDLIIVAARPSMGKTAFALNIALKVIEHNKGVAIFSLEMPAEQLLLRMLSAKTSIPLQNLKVGDMNDQEWTNLANATDEISKKSLFVDDGGVVTIHQVRSKLRKLKSKHPEISLAIIDYLQLMIGVDRKDRHLEVSDISRGLKLLARELEIPIIALSQLNRSLESRSDKRPMLSDLRESGAIEQDADTILFVYRDDVYKIREEKEREKRAKDEGKEYKSNFFEKPEEDAEIIIGKQRNGPTGVANLIFQKKFTRFVDRGDIPIEIIYEDSSLPETKIEMPQL